MFEEPEHYSPVDFFRAHKNFIFIALGVALLVNGTMLPVSCVTVPPHLVATSGMFFILLIPALGALCCLLLSILALLFKRTRVPGLLVLFLSICWIVLFVAAFFGGMAVKNATKESAFMKIADSGMPIVEAVNKFEKLEGRLPLELNELVPRYLAEIPTTTIGKERKWEFIQDASKYDGNPWVLRVEFRSGFLGFDSQVIIYYPNQYYSKGDKRIGQWAYFYIHS